MSQPLMLEKQNKYLRTKTPICTITKVSTGFRCFPNKATSMFIRDIGFCNVEWLFNQEVVACVPSEAEGSYKPAVKNGNFYGYYVPRCVYEKTPLRAGHYKLYRYKNGFCFKRSERQEDLNDE